MVTSVETDELRDGRIRIDDADFDALVAACHERGIRVIIAGAGGAAHLPGMTAAMTPLPVFGVPIQSQALSGRDSLLSIVQMPAGIPTATFAIGDAGAVNAALFAVAMLARFRPAIEQFGPWFYRRLFWETGAIGQMLYLVRLMPLRQKLLG